MTKPINKWLWRYLLGSLLMIQMLSGCADQVGKHRITSRQSVDLQNGAVDLLIGEGMNDEEGERPLLAIVVCDPSLSITRGVRIGDEGRSVSSINLDLYSGENYAFHYGAAWNRISDVVVVENTAFDRTKGAVFLITGSGAGRVIFQLDGLALEKLEGIDQVGSVIAQEALNDTRIPAEVGRVFYESWRKR